jgi:putative ABC transport system permease protein
MRIYTLPLKNLHQNKLRNISTVLRISLGVIILLILVSSGLGINSFIEKSGSSDGKILGTAQTSQNVNTTQQTNIVTSTVDYLNSVFGSQITENQLFNRLEDFLVNVVYILDGLASVALLIGVLGIMNTMGFNLSERTKEIGILKSLGFTERQILLSCTLEAGLLGLMGSVIGVILGSIIIWIISTFIDPELFTILLPLWLIPGAIFITTFLSLILGLYPAWFTSKLDAVEILRYG